MSLCSLTTRKLDVPGEDGQWIEIRPLSAKRLHVITLEAKKQARAALEADPEDSDAEGYALSSLMLGEAIVDWSYDAPVDSEHIDDLEIGTTTWLVGEMNKGAEVPLPSSLPSTESSMVTIA